MIGQICLSFILALILILTVNALTMRVSWILGIGMIISFFGALITAFMWVWQ